MEIGWGVGAPGVFRKGLCERRPLRTIPDVSHTYYAASIHDKGIWSWLLGLNYTSLKLVWADESMLLLTQVQSFRHLPGSCVWLPQISALLPDLINSASSRKTFWGHPGATLSSLAGQRLGSTSVCLSGSEQGRGGCGVRGGHRDKQEEQPSPHEQLLQAQGEQRSWAGASHLGLLSSLYHWLAVVGVSVPRAGALTTALPWPTLANVWDSDT